jgi:hypothetical protein
MMKAKTKRFIVLVFSDRDNFGLNEHTLPPLIALMDSARPDFRNWSHTGPIGFLLASRDALRRVRQAIDQVEKLKTTDPRFDSLNIGLAEGPMLAEFNFWSRLNPKFMPVGSASIAASKNADEAGAFRQVLEEISSKI